MAKEKKYEWKLGSPLPFLDEHSQTKHHVISDYLQRYAEVVMAHHAMEKLSMTIVDGFSGGGKYINRLTDELVDGSPFLILKAIQEAEIKINIGSNKARKIDAEYHFIESEPSHIEYLEHELNNSSFKHLFDHKMYLHKAKFSEAANQIIQRIKIRNPRTQRAIFILDQYSYKDVPFALVKRILTELTNGEVILTFNFDTAQSYISDAPSNRKAFSNIQLEQYISWDRLAQHKEDGNWHAAIQEQLANAIYKASSAKHITLFFIHPKRGRSYWLVHLSNIYRARDVMMEIHWKHANNQPYFTHHLSAGIFALGYQALEVPGQSNLALCDDKTLNKEAAKRCIDALSEELPRLIYESKNPLTFSQLTDQIGSFTVASEAHIKSSLQLAIDSGELSITTEKGSIRRSASRISSSDLMTYKQFPLVFI